MSGYAHIVRNYGFKNNIERIPWRGGCNSRATFGASPLNRLSACDAQTQAKSPDCFMVILLMTLAGAADSQQDSIYCFRSNFKTKHLKNERENKELRWDPDCAAVHSGTNTADFHLLPKHLKLGSVKSATGTAKTALVLRGGSQALLL